MAANLAKSNVTKSGFALGILEGTPQAWHGLGNFIPTEFGNNAQQFAERSGVLFDVELVPVTLDSSGTPIKCDKSNCWVQFLRRDDNQHVIATVGNNWTLHTMKQSLPFIQTLLDTGRCQLDTVGSLFNGRLNWFNLTLGKVDIGGNDIVRNRLMHTVPYQVSAVGNYLTPTRTVCWNTWQLGIANAFSKLRVYHGQNVTPNVKLVLECLNMADEEFQATAEQWQQLKRATIAKGDIEQFVKKLFNVKPNEEVKAKQLGQIERIIDLAINGKGNNGSSLWDLINGVTEYYNHEAGHARDTRFESTMFGTNSKMIDKAFTLAFDMLAS